MKKKKFGRTMALILLCAVMSFTGIFASFAATIGNSSGWQRTSNGWRYQKSDGSLANTEWIWIGEESTGYRCYFFDSNGNLITNAITPEGYRVDANGAWVENGQVQVRMYVDTTRAPFGTEVTYGDAIPTVTLSTYLSSLIDVRNSASGFPNRKYIQTMENGDTLFDTMNNDTQIKIQTNYDASMVVAIAAPARLMFMNFPQGGIEQSALYYNMRNQITSQDPIYVSSSDMAVYFSKDPSAFTASGMIVMSDGRYFEVSIELTQGRDGRYYIYPSNSVFMKLHIP